MNGAWHLLQAAEQLAQREEATTPDSSNESTSVPLADTAKIESVSLVTPPSGTDKKTTQQPVLPSTAPKKPSASNHSSAKQAQPVSAPSVSPSAPLTSPSPSAPPKRKRLRDDLQERLDGCQKEVRSLTAEKLALQDRCKAAEEAISRRNTPSAAPNFTNRPLPMSILGPGVTPMASSLSGPVVIPAASSRTVNESQSARGGSPGCSTVSGNPDWAPSGQGQPSTRELNTENLSQYQQSSSLLQPSSYSSHVYNGFPSHGGQDQRSVPGALYPAHQMVMGLPQNHMMMGAPQNFPYYVYTRPHTRP